MLSVTMICSDLFQGGAGHPSILIDLRKMNRWHGRMGEARKKRTGPSSVSLFTGNLDLPPPKMPPKRKDWHGDGFIAKARRDEIAKMGPVPFFPQHVSR
jgi:hypothetical protein